MNEFLNKCVIITGASQGIGLQTAKQFNQLGAKVILLARTQEKLEQAQKNLQHPEKSEIYSCDLSNPEVIDGTFKTIIEKNPTIHVLVNNIGSFSDKIAWNQLEHDVWTKAFETNTLSAYHTSVIVSDNMIKNKVDGVIINVGSSAALQFKNNRIQYTVTKSAEHTLSQVMALDLAKHNIRVNVVSPGPTTTEVVQARIDDPKQVEAEIVRQSKIPLNRYASMEDIANAIIFLSSSKASFITGAILPVDGGYTIGQYTPK